MGKYKKVFKVFLAGEENKESKWLTKMSKNGYHLENVNFSTYYTFKKGEPKEYSYLIDMKESGVSDDEEYTLIYEEMGFKYIDKSNGYYYFRGNADINIDEIDKSEKGRYLNRIKIQSNIILLASIVNIICFLLNFVININTSESHGWIIYINLFIAIGLAILYTNMRKNIKFMIKSGVKEPYKSSIKDWSILYRGLIVLVTLIIILIALSMGHIFFI